MMNSGLSCSPSSGAVRGGTVVDIRHSLSQFLDVPSLACKFGGNGRVLASFITGSNILCVAPSAATDGAVTLEVSNNNQDLEGSLSFTYYGILREI